MVPALYSILPAAFSYTSQSLPQPVDLLHSFPDQENAERLLKYMSAPKYFRHRFLSHQADTLYISSNTPDSFYSLYLKMKYASPALLGHNEFRQTGNGPNTIHSPPRNLKFNQKQDGSHTKHTIPFLFERIFLSCARLMPVRRTGRIIMLIVKTETR